MEQNRSYKRGDIYYINFNNCQTQGSEQNGTRPAIIVSNDMANTYSPVLIVVFLTTQNKKPLPTHVCVQGLSPSTALCEEPTSVDVGRIGQYIRTCTNEEMKEVDKALKIALGLTGKYKKMSENNTEVTASIRAANA